MSNGGARALLLIGSPKGVEKSSSACVGRLLVDRLESRGWAGEAIHLHAAVRTEESRKEMLDAIDRASVVLLASPLYVDSLPAPAIRAIELIAAHRHPGNVSRIPRFVSLINCGFLEPSQNDTCQQILRRFAENAGFEWLTGISLGAAGRVSKRVREAFDILAEALDLEILVPSEVERLTRKPLMPGWLYVVVGNFMWRRWADRNGVKDRLRARPHEGSGP